RSPTFGRNVTEGPCVLLYVVRWPNDHAVYAVLQILDFRTVIVHVRGDEREPRSKGIENRETHKTRHGENARRRQRNGLRAIHQRSREGDPRFRGGTLLQIGPTATVARDDEPKRGNLIARQ